MNAHAGFDYVGADGHSYPEVASRAVRSTHYNTPSPVYGYLRTGLQQKIYLFRLLEEARQWLTALSYGQSPYDYAAVFAATDLTRPVRGLESFGPASVSVDASVGQVLPFLLGLPLGGVGGYYLRKWQEGHPGQVLPGLPFAAPPSPIIPDSGGRPQMAGDYPLEAPWMGCAPTVGCGAGGGFDGPDGYTIGGPWLDKETVVGAQDVDVERRSVWPQTKALIQSAIQEVTEAFVLAPAGAYVWSLEPASASTTSGITLEGTTYIESFPSAAEALTHMRDRIQNRFQAPYVALALFNSQSLRWPNPTNWTRSNDPSYAPVIAQQAAKYAPVRAAGAYVGAIPAASPIGTALNDVRARAQSIASKRAGRVIGVIHTTQDGMWHALAFGTPDDADDWFGTSTQVPESYTYAAYYDKNDYMWPRPLNEKIGGARSPSRPGRPIRRPPATVAGTSWGM